MVDLKTHRLDLRLSLHALSHKAAVSRYRLWEAEQGTLTLTPDEELRIKGALHNEGDLLINKVDRLKSLLHTIDAGAAEQPPCAR